jgi:hypothetical protein
VLTIARSIACWLAVGCTPLNDLTAYSDVEGEVDGGRSSPPLPPGAASERRPVAGSIPRERLRTPPLGSRFVLADDTVSLPLANAVPRITSVSPADGARGVSNDVAIVVTFSESMDTELAEAAFDSDDIDPDLAEFSWSDSDRVLTIRPGVPLEYASGEDPALVEARSYAYEFSSVARNLYGNGLGLATFSFYTRRQITRKVPASTDRSQTGNWTSRGVHGESICAVDGDFVCVGDGAVATDAQYKGFLTFDLGVIDGGAPIEEARLRLAVADVRGRALDELGKLSLEPVEFTVIDDLAFSSTAIDAPATRPTIFGNVLRADVSEALRRQSVRALVQHRLSFEIPTNADGVADLITLDRRGLELLVTQLVP